MPPFHAPKGVQILAPIAPQDADTLSVPALAFLATLNRAFNTRRKELLVKRDERVVRLEHGETPDFSKETQKIRDGIWTAAPPAPGLVDRRVEITGPPERKMLINALNSGASTFMCDFEDSNAPTWTNVVRGQTNCRDAVRRTITFTNPNGKFYKLNDKIATLLVRPRGWHMEEKHVLVDGEPMSASLFDFGLYFFHNAKELWNDVFNLSQDMLEIPRGTIRGTVLIETILAAFEMDEIIYELKEHSSGLNCGRWDYIFSYIKKFKHDPKYVLPDRSEVGMTTPFMDAYVRLLIKTCHKRGVHAMGGMAAQIPIKDDPAKNKIAMDQVTQDKEREVKAGHDGTWVAHPDLVKLALDVFNKHMPQPNQLFVLREDVMVTGADLISTKGISKNVTEKGVRLNINVSLQYMEAWLRGLGCVPIHNMMEDAATAEISRSQVWQWAKHNVKTVEGIVINASFVSRVLDEETQAIKKSLHPSLVKGNKFDEAQKLLEGTLKGEGYSDFLTTLAYDSITSVQSQSKL